MKIDQDGWISGVEKHPSPNMDDRPEDAEIELLVIHNISLPPGEFGGRWIQDLFLNQLDSSQHPYFEQISDLRVSAHLLIRRDGHVIQFVPLGKRAWHAGVSCWQDKEKCNDFSIGIELEGTDEIPFTDKQYTVLTELTMIIMQHYPAINTNNITGHSDIASDRKTDPGPHFDWPRYKKAIAS